MKKQRKHHTPEEKVYRWQKEFFENGAAAFRQRGRTNHQAEQERIAYLEKRIQTKDEVLAEWMAEHVARFLLWASSCAHYAG
jgi:transposase